MKLMDEFKTFALKGNVVDMAVGIIIDVAEIVEIDVDHRDRRAQSSGADDGFFRLFREMVAVGQVGQRVVIGQVFQTLLEVFEFVDVAVDGEIVGDVAIVVANGPDADKIQLVVAVFPAVPEFPLPLPGSCDFPPLS